MQEPLASLYSKSDECDFFFYLWSADENDDRYLYLLIETKLCLGLCVWLKLHVSDDVTMMSWIEAIFVQGHGLANQTLL